MLTTVAGSIYHPVNAYTYNLEINFKAMLINLDRSEHKRRSDRANKLQHQPIRKKNTKHLHFSFHNENRKQKYTTDGDGWKL